MSEANVPAIPEYMKQFMNRQSKDVDSAAAASTSVPRVSLRGKKFRFIENGEEVKAVNDEVDVVIYGIEPDAGRFIKTYYDKPYAGQASSGEPPTCSSEDGVRPSPWIGKPQSPTCAQCPKNMFGSATSMKGRPSKACKDSKRIWVGFPGDPEGVLYGMNITVSSLKALSQYGSDRRDSGVPLSLTITKITMMDDSEFPQLDFAVAGYIEADKAEAFITRAEKREWEKPIVQPQLAAPQTPTASLPKQGDVPTGPVDTDSVVNNW